MKKAALFATAMAISLGANAEPVPIFGLPVGGKLQSMPKECPFSMIGNYQSKTLCWIGKPFVYKPTGARLGSIQPPNQDKFPAWAAYALFEAEISKNAELERIRVKLSDGTRMVEIIQSISSRFGWPTSSKVTQTAYPYAHWNLPNILIEAACDNKEYCAVEVMSPREKAAREKERKDQRDKEAARSFSP